MIKLVNRAKMSTATTGTGTITLGSAESGYQSFAAAGVADGDVTRNVFEDGDAWEISTGTYSSTGPTLTRTLVESSTGSLLNLSGDAVVYVSAVAEDFSAGGAYKLISTTAISASVASVEFTGLSGYESYKFIISGITFETAGAYTTANFSTDNGSTYPLLRILRAAFASSTSGTVAENYFSNDNQTSLILSTGATSTDLTPSYFIEGAFANNDGNPLGFVNVAYASQDNIFEHGLGSFMFGFTTVPDASVNAIKFSASSGNITSGKVSIYGVSS